VGLFGFTIALAASGDLDTTFDGDGLVTSYAVPSDPARVDASRSVAIQANGKIVAAGQSYVASTPLAADFAIIRYNSNGTFDTTFSGDGRLITNFGGRDAALDVAVQANGKIVAAGERCSNSNICDVALARYNSNGSLDTTFSGNGKQTSDFGGGDNGAYGGLTIQSNGKIVVAGHMWNGTDNDFAVYRYLSNGNLDTTFSGDGMVNIGFGAGRQDYALDLVIQSDGKIVVIGYTGDASNNNNNFAVARLNTNGSLDHTFSGDGRQITNMGGDDYAYSVALQTDGKMVAVGEKFAIPGTGLSYFALARYNTDGSLDTTFNGTGRKVFSFTSGAYSQAVDVLVQSDGKIVAMGTADNGFGTGSLDFALVRLNTNGSFDTTFSGNGKATVDFGGGIDRGSALALQPSDGKYVLAGDTFDGAQTDFALARVLP
jgi:uncharacterized delta-60 repeat protein